MPNIALTKIAKHEFDFDQWKARWDKAGMSAYLEDRRSATSIMGFVSFEDALVSQERQDLAILFHPDAQLNRPELDTIWAFVPTENE